jgi:CMP-N-acetylneuraminic acid synthetase
MNSDKKVIAVIPARGGSKRIPRKNVRLIAGKPLIAYTIENALNCKNVDKVVVSTEDEEIREIAKIYGAEVIDRPEELARDDVTLDPVIFHALKAVEQKEKTNYDYVITLQPTSVLISKDTIERAVDVMLNSGHDTLIGVKNATHLYWTKKRGSFVPLYAERKNTQFLDPIVRETGFFISRRDVVKENSRFGKSVHLFEMPAQESIDVDTYQDLWVVESLLKRLKIIFRVDGDRLMGMGHVHRAITLANRMSSYNEIVFLMDKTKGVGINKVKENNYSVVSFEDEDGMFRIIENLKPDILINDILDTDKDYVLRMKRAGVFVVNFEDLGDGSNFADITVNSIYENSLPPKNHYYGFNYECLRDEFFVFPVNEIRKEVKNILVTFGGTDQNNLTLRVLKVLEKLNYTDKKMTVVLGMGYGKKEELKNYIERLRSAGFEIEMRENVRLMSKLIRDGDIVVTSNGRTIYEVSSLGTPCISISQNEREVRHMFAHMSKGIINLGLASNVSDEYIRNAIEKLVKDYEMRKEMNKKMLSFDLRGGTRRVINLIFDNYWTWRMSTSNELIS